MILQLSGRSRQWRCCALVQVLLVTLGLLYVIVHFHFHNVRKHRPPLPHHLSSLGESLQNSAPKHNIGFEESTQLPNSDFLQLVTDIYKRTLHPIDTPTFFAKDGDKFTYKHKPKFTVPLGKTLAIIDCDTRPLDKPGDIFHESAAAWEELSRLSAGMLNHYLYSLVHGYDYIVYKTQQYAGRDGGWPKVAMMKEALRTHDYVIFVDSDALFNNINLPMEWLFNYWDINEKHILAMAQDPDVAHNYDSHGRSSLNTGFVWARKGERTDFVLNEWANCPEDPKYKFCGKWATDWSHEQRAFSEYFRTPLGESGELMELSCSEMNGRPSVYKDTGCKGTFLRHFWQEKDGIMYQFTSGILDAVVPQLHEQFLAEDHVIDKKEFVLQGANAIHSSEAARATATGFQ